MLECYAYIHIYSNTKALNHYHALLQVSEKQRFWKTGAAESDFAALEEHFRFQCVD